MTAPVDDVLPLPPPEPGTSSTSALRGIDRAAVVRVAIVLGAVLLAYHYSLQSLLKAFSLDTPLAHVGLVPFIALGLAWLRRRPSPDEPDIQDRQLDLIVGIPLVIGALVANMVLPAQMSIDFWTMRVDLFTLPFFVAGVVAIVFGIRVVWRIRLALCFLFLVWPWPYNLVLDRWLTEFTNVTIAALKVVLGVVPLATAVAGSDGSVFSVDHAGTAVQMSVASACSGANGLVGFLLIGTAFLFCVKGPRLRKVAWLAVGAAIVWALNVVRILVIFFAAKQWGEAVALDGFHPVAGLVVFNLGVVGMLLLMPRFRLRFASSVAARPRASVPAANAPAVVVVPPPPPVPPRAPRRPPLPRLRGAGVVLALVVAALCYFNGNLEGNDSISSSLGTPRLQPFSRSQERPDGFTLRKSTTYDWAKRFFGSDSVWTRYFYTPDHLTGADPTVLRANTSLVADVIETGDRAGLDAYGVEACYKFHDYKISRQQSVDLGNGLVGNILTWTIPDDGQTWTTLYWHWPVRLKEETRYERVTLLVGDSPNNDFSYPPLEEGITKGFQLQIRDLLRGSSAGDAASNQRLVRTSEFMVSFARQMIAKRTPAKTEG
jgi:exosortase